MTKPIRVLLQTTIPNAEDDWNIGGFLYSPNTCARSPTIRVRSYVK